MAQQCCALPMLAVDPGEACDDGEHCDDGSECAIGGSWIVFSVGGPWRLGSLQFSADYTGSGIRFFGRGGDVKCVGLIDGVISSLNDDQ